MGKRTWQGHQPPSRLEEIIRLILHIQNEEAGINLSLREQPDLDGIETFYLQSGGYFRVALNEQGEVIGAIALMSKGGGIGVLKKFLNKLAPAHPTM